MALRSNTQMFRPQKPQRTNTHTQVPLQTGLRFHSRGYEQPPHQRAYGITNSRWLAGDRSTSATTTSVSDG
jgi:hypothetical protein